MCVSKIFPIPDEKGGRKRSGVYEPCRIQFHAVSFLVIGRMAAGKRAAVRPV